MISKSIRLIKTILSYDFVRFGIVGVLNTLIGTSVMFICYNCFSFGYWLSSAMNYIVGSIFSFFANKYFTFRNSRKSVLEIIKFILNISICYFLAYGIAIKVVRYIITNLLVLSLSDSVVDQVSMLIGMILFVLLNYCGQKLFVFQKRTEEIK